MAKLSEISLGEVKAAIRVDYSDDDILIGQIAEAARGYIQRYTGLSPDELDGLPEMVIAFYCLCSDMYDIREMNVQNVRPNPTVEQILKGNARNYV